MNKQRTVQEDAGVRVATEVVAMKRAVGSAVVELPTAQDMETSHRMALALGITPQTTNMVLVLATVTRVGGRVMAQLRGTIVLQAMDRATWGLRIVVSTVLTPLPLEEATPPVTLVVRV